MRSAGLIAAGAAVTVATGEAAEAAGVAEGGGPAPEGERGDLNALVASPVATLARTDVGVSVSPFPLSAVSLLDSPFKANMGRTLSYLSFVDADRLLHTFRLNVGLTSSAQACGGWGVAEH